jgi:hypothetical protein
MDNQFCEYVVNNYTDEKKDENGITLCTRMLWRVSVIRSRPSQQKRIIKDGFENEEAATAYAEQWRADR